MNLGAYQARLEDTLRSRHDLAIESLDFRQKRKGTIMTARVRFYDQSFLGIVEEVIPSEARTVEKVRYVFHYQSADGALIFRYDNSPHYPDLPTFPSHKHTPNGVFAAEAPDLADVLREIDGILYPAL